MLTWLGNVASLKYFIAELWLALACCVVLMLPLIPRFKNTRMSWIAIAALVLAGVFVLALPTSLESEGGLFFGMLALDGLSKFFKIFFVITALVVVLMTEVGREVPDFRKPEFYSILLGVLIGSFLAASATDLLMMYLAIELLSLGSYVLAGFSRIEKTSDEASMKYILYGGLSTGVMLFGMSYLYGLTGFTNLVAIREALEANQIHPLVFFISFLLIMVGIGYKISAVPFHFWAPDVYQGAPTSITAFLSVASKGAGFAAFIRIFYTSFLSLNGEGLWEPVAQLDWRVLLSILAIVTMTFGNLAAFGQNNVKRLLAYSGIAHAGYILVGAIALNEAGVQSMLFYLLTYLFTNLAAFTVVLILADCNGVEEIEGYKSLGTRAPWLAFCLGVALFSLIGVPPMAGFLGKWFLFASAVRTLDPWCVAAVVAGLLNSVLSVYYYFRIMRAMYLEKDDTAAPIRSHAVLNGVVTVMTLPVLLIIFDGGSLYDWTGTLSKLLLG